MCFKEKAGIKKDLGPFLGFFSPGIWGILEFYPKFPFKAFPKFLGLHNELVEMGVN